uniref:Uncharacterized protein n=1 Tax=Pipistrellus kuhlii TaxID=59472 RepID=A0A7J7V0F2_PIPKU|nr:hypothetical protein mPipKuh1_008619 [Pipistrellus kuhlii]
MVTQACTSTKLTRLPMYDACALPHTSRVSQALLRCFICCPSPKASCVQGLLHRRSWEERPCLPWRPRHCSANQRCSEEPQRRWLRGGGGCGPLDTGQGLGDVSRSPSCSNESLETRRLPGKAIEGHTLQAESTVRAEGPSDVCSVVGLRCGWSVWVEGSQMCWEISRTGGGGPRGAAGSELSPKGRGCLGSLEGGCQGEAAAETQRGVHPREAVRSLS